MATTPILGLELTAAAETTKLFSAYRNGMSDNVSTSNLYKIDTAIGLLNNKISGKNLLYNWDFQNPINQRGQSSYGSDGYTIDRWAKSGDMTVVVVNGGIALDNTSGASTGVFLQKIENWLYMIGDRYTISAELTDGTRVSGSAIIAATMDTQFPIYSGTTEIGHLDFYTPSADIGTYRIAIYAGYSINIKRCKFEKGVISTLANNPPADYGEELLKCKRFYRLWTTEAARTEALKEVGLMRLASPTTGAIVIGGVTYYYASADL